MGKRPQQGEVYSYGLALRGVLLGGVALLGACTAPAPRPMGESPAGAIGTVTDTDSLGREIAIRAISLVGHPYRYGGADLEGFDCSGLVLFIHEQLGLRVPRTAADQQRAARQVARSELEPGDLLFFRTQGSRISHVGVYVGENRFVHAPQPGRLIELRSLDDAYYARHLAGAGRLWPRS